MLIVGRNLHAYGDYDSPDLRTLREACAEAGIRLQDCILADPSTAPAVIARKRPHLTVALGDEAARVCIPSLTLTAQECRGYIFEGTHRNKVLVTVSPEQARTIHVPWRILLATDLKRAKEQSCDGRLNRPTRTVDVVTSEAHARRATQDLLAAKRLAYDIEVYDADRIACVGFSGSPERAVVFPAPYLRFAREILESPRVRKCGQNGQFDMHFLATRCGIVVNNYCDDTLVAWHACYPELAGASIDSSGKKRGSKRTHKSLAFFGSVFTLDEWWKDYEFANDHEMYVLNGRDCCITLESMDKLDELIDQLGVRSIYEHEISLIEPFVRAQARGLHVDDELRRERIATIEARIASYDADLDAIVLPLLRDRIDDLPDDCQHLFRKSKRCDCCNSGAKAKLACWRCAGYEKAPGKRALAEGEPLAPCKLCDGAGRHEWIEFNGRSVDQKRIVLYDLLKLPKRYNKGKLSTDEDALRGIIGQL